MRKTFCYAVCMLLALSGDSQPTHQDSIRMERRQNMYANRKYSYGISETFYGFAANSTIYHASDVIFSARIKALDISKITSFELTGGASYQPYQGFRLHMGFDYEWLTPTKVHLYVGAQYALGLKQLTVASNSLSSVIVGYHSYLVPFMGIMYWPGKRDIEKLRYDDSTEKFKYRHPTFWQLVYVKAQAGYSALISQPGVYPSETFDNATAGHIRQNTGSCLYLSIGLGINLPSFGNNKRKDYDLLHALRAD